MSPDRFCAVVFLAIAIVLPSFAGGGGAAPEEG